MSARLIALLTAALAAASLATPARADDAYQQPQNTGRLEQSQQYQQQPAALYPGGRVWPDVGPWVVGYPKDYPDDAKQQAARPPIGSGPARIGVFVPEGAEVWVNGEEPADKSAPRLREYVTPFLVRGPDYRYEVRACWVRDGKTVDETRTVAVHANGWASVDFTRPEAGR